MLYYVKIIIIEELEVLMGKDLVVKSNEFVEAKYKLTPPEAKIISLLVSHIEKDDKDFKLHTFPARYLMELTGLGQENYSELKEITKNLMKKILEIREGNKFIQVAFLSGAVYHDGEGLVDLQFSPILKPYLLELKDNFIKYKITQILTLKSFYSIRFYELLVKWKNLKCFTLSLTEIRELFKITEKDYPLYANIKQRIILTAQNELKEKADLYFTFEEIKHVRKVNKLKFTVIEKNTEEKPTKQLPSPVETEKHEETFNQELLNRLTDSFALSEKQSKKILTQYDETYITEILNVVEKDYKEGKVRKIAPYLLKALHDDFRPKQTAHDKELEHKKKGQEQRISKVIEEKEILKNLENDFRNLCNQKAIKIISTLTPEEIDSEFADWLLKNNEFTFRIYKTKGKNNFFVQIELGKYVIEKYLPAEEQDFITYARSKGYSLEKKAGEYKVLQNQLR